MGRGTKPVTEDISDARLYTGHLERSSLEYIHDNPGCCAKHICDYVSEKHGVAWRTARQCIDSLIAKKHIKRVKLAAGQGHAKPTYLTTLGEAALTGTSLRYGEYLTSNEMRDRVEANKTEPPIPPPERVVEKVTPMADPLTGAATNGLMAALQQHATKVTLVRDEAETDPIKWIQAARPKIETKTHGLVVYEPTPFQKTIIRKTVAKQRFILEKSRQIGASTAVQIGAAWMVLFDVPFHGHIVANKAEVAVQRILRISKRALETCIMPDEMRKRLYTGTDNTNEIKFSGAKSDNYLRAHAASPDAGHSFDGNWVVLEEFSRMPDAEQIQSGMHGMLDEASCGLVYVSTHNGFGTLFHQLCEKAESVGLERIKATWRVHPGRDEAWKERKIAEMGEDEFMEAHECAPMLLGDAAIDWPKLAQMARVHHWIGPVYSAGHKYLIGIDQASGGECDTVACVIDATIRPAQVVELKTFKSTSDEPGTRTQQKIDFIEELPLIWPAKRVFIDATNEVGTTSLVNVQGKVCVKITDNRGTNINEGYNQQDRMRELKIPRTRLVDHAITCLERGKVIVHQEHFKPLYEAFKSITKGHRYKGVAKNIGGKHLDEFDAFILACQGLTYSGTSGDNVRRATGIPGDKSWQDLREERY